MFARLTVLLLAAVVAGAPTARIVCETGCAEVGERSPAAVHACHEMAAAPDAGGPFVGALAHPCGHAEEAPGSVAQSAVSADHAVAHDAGVLTPPAAALVAHDTLRIVVSPPGSRTTPLPLRI
jgi:hypothetical protein